ncbi:transcription termination/antitermination protein NusG [Aestuariicoccus sp. MJ-SS9]|uniref:transcription termination/antitermination protein NusG n=1 Tax=Aestuariicoccus sp. MJ-SS9 TaxID=3079855 RepID=UPI0029158845|nr:transcription termination/antitermination NusG family protein [Aestuariicoccus sp. MJ-SS9]MDU8914013.1 transcription termination/antitermination NusG family protein [Aestuariicoccus sp. MJ-SS9]
MHALTFEMQRFYTQLTGATLENSKAQNWFVAQLKPNGLSRAQRNLERQGYRHFSPYRQKTARRGATVVSSSQPLFPGYIFVQFDPEHPGWQAIGYTRGISRLVLSDIRRPRSLPASFMSGLIERCDERGAITPLEADFHVGDRIRVLAGPFSEIVSTIEKLEPGERLRILIDLMGRKVPVKVPFNKVERLAGAG